MSTVAFFSAKQAPGATTAAMLVASLWERPALLADCDPAGGDVALRLPQPDGRPLAVDRGLLTLLPLARRPLEPATLLDHAQTVLGGGEVLAGLTGPEQAGAAGPVWPTLANAFAGLGSHDVIVDAGRLDTRSPVLPLVQRADVATCVVDASVSGVYAARARLRVLLGELAHAEYGGPRVAFVVRAERRREADDAAGLLLAEFDRLDYLGHLPHDPVGARIFDGRPVSRPERTLLVRAGADLVAQLGGLLWAMGWTAAEPTPPEESPANPAPPPPADGARRFRRSRDRERAGRR